MMRIFLIASLVAFLVACDNSNQSPTTSQDRAAATSESHESHEGCQCGAGKTGQAVWCDKCGVGYVDGKKVTDKAAVDKAAVASAHAKDCKCGDKADCKCGDKADY